MKEIFRNKQKLGIWLRKNKRYLKPKLNVIEKQFVDDIFDELFKESNFRKLDLYKEALDCILANLIFYGRKQSPLTNPNPIYYTEHKWATRTIFKNILVSLVRADYCHHWKGFKHKHNQKFSYPAKYFPTEKIINNYIHVKNKKPESCILLYKKDAKKRRVLKPYTETWFTRKLNRHVNMINDTLKTSTVKFKYKVTNANYLYNPSFENQVEYLLNANHIKLITDQGVVNEDLIWMDTIYGTRLYVDNEYEFEISNESLYVYRSFNRGKWEFGGRFYTPVFQGIPSAWRKTITIDDEETVELDYSAHHIRLLYHEEGLEFDGEPYVYAKDDVENADNRMVHKYIAMIAINAIGKGQTINAVCGAIEDDYDAGKYTSDIPTKVEIEQHYDEFIKHHEPIANYVSNDAGIKLQRKDSDIMNEILLELALEKIVGLPVHDSVIVKLKHKNKLKQEMTKQYFKMINKQPQIS